jgi:TRAP-type C4-dicarboxylate transport system permease small subunit
MPCQPAPRNPGAHAANRLQRIARLLALLEDTLLSLLLVGVIGLAFAQIVLRNLADSSFSWADPLLRVAVLWLALIGAIAATRDDNHIRIDLLSRYLPPQLAQPLKRLTDLFSALLCALIAWHGYLFVQMERLQGGIAFSNIPAWLLQLVIPVGFALMALRFFSNAVKPVAVNPLHPPGPAGENPARPRKPSGPAGQPPDERT